MTVAFANGSVKAIELIGGVKIRLCDRACCIDAFVLPGNTGPLLRAITFEGMELVLISLESSR